ncbi:MAG: O-Antigen ligase [Firmicutes bacterium ADurb.Bin182]|nr:MAG: O-Antigen ligase [Firmicutes bacterium ADurb.Bin182]
MRTGGFSERDLRGKINSNIEPRNNIFVGLVQYLFSFELTFALFLFAWAYKADPRFSFSIDPTQLFFMISVFSGTLVFIAEKKRIGKKAGLIVLSGIAFVMLALLSLVWTEGDLYAQKKALYLSTLTLWALIGAAVIIASDKTRMVRFLNSVLLFSVWIAAQSTMEYINNGPGVINLNSNYLALGYTMGMGSLILAAYGFFSDESRLKRAFMLIACVYFIFLLLIMGGRGPLIGCLASLSVPLLAGGRSQIADKSKLKGYILFTAVLFSAIVLASLYFYLKDLPAATLERMLLFLDSGMGTSVGTRIEYYSVAQKLWLSRPLSGYGIGSWPVLNGLPDSIAYPHNLILEILVEMGIAGLLLFGLAVFFAFKNFNKQIAPSAAFPGPLNKMLFFNVIIGAMFSGDLNDNRILFAVLGLMAYEEKQIEE